MSKFIYIVIFLQKNQIKNYFVILNFNIFIYRIFFFIPVYLLSTS